MATLLQLCQPFDHAVMAVIQQLSGAMMDKIMLVFTFLGEETFAILLLIAVYWCWDKRIGEYLLFSLYTAMSLNGLLKDIICRVSPTAGTACHLDTDEANAAGCSGEVYGEVIL